MSSDQRRVVIVGAGQAGAAVAIRLRQLGFAGPITLIGEEPHPPYQRPPLSKAFLADETAIERTYLRSPGFYAKQRIDMQLGCRARAIRREARVVESEDGREFAYDALVVCTGTRARRLQLSGEHLGGVFYLRAIDEAQAIKAALVPGARAVIIGGGYIGLEIAASLRKHGCAVSVLEALGRVLNRVVAPPVSDFFHAEHERQGVRIATGAMVEALAGRARVERVVCRDGRAFDADLVVIGVGAVPNDELAEAAGLEIDDGIVVDQLGRTSDPAIFAAGDVTNHPNALFDRRLRLESVHNAMAQAKAVAAAIAGRPEPYVEVPWFWSDQYDLKLQIAGLADPDAEHLLRGDPAARSFSYLHLQGGRMVAIDAINRPGDFLAAKRLIRDGVVVDPARVTDVGIKLSELSPT